MKHVYDVVVKDFSFTAEADSREWITARISRALRDIGFTDVSLEVQAALVKGKKK